MPKIKVHEKALAHLSRGLYRSPASALRELVSNAWDANAKTVRISTNYPSFFQLAVEDNGDGFTMEEFSRVMAGGIGNSEKRSDERPMAFGRPIIGRLGIGMLGIAQIAPSFTVASKTKDGEGFRAEVKLYDLLKERLDQEDPELIRDSSGPAETYKTVDIGTYEFDKSFDPGTRKAGTLIIATDVHPQFTEAFQQSLKGEEFIEVPSDWKQAIRKLSKVDSLQQLGDYWRLLWELSAACPIPYIDANAVPNHMIKADQERLLSYNFRLLVDDIQLFKPVLLKGDRYRYITRGIKDRTRKIYGKNVAFHGYLAVRDGQQIRPDELRGILIRVNNVGILGTTIRPFSIIG
jgi:hypothetical protein